VDFDLFVIGGGSGGVRCARVAASHGARVGIAEERFWGGTCVNVGCVPKKLMVQAADYGGAVQDARGFGWQTAQCAHHWPEMIQAINAEVLRLSGIYRELLLGSKVAVFDARARFVDAHTLDVGGRRVSAEHIVIATGGHPVKPVFEGCELGSVSDDVFTLPEMPARVIILGGGYIGVEFAGVFAGLGAQVDLVYRQPLPLRGFDDEIREALAETLAAEGVTLHPTRSIAALRRGSDGLVATFNDGIEHAADFVLYATGRRAAIEGLGLEDIGVAVGADRAIVVDCDRRTSVPHVYAIGDVVDHVNLTPIALAHGHMLAEKLFGGGKRDWNFDQVPTAVFSRPPIATVGPSEMEAGRHALVDVFVTHFTPLKHRLTGRRHHRTVMKLIVEHGSGRVIGAHMMGDDAPEIIQGLAIAITAGATKTDVDRTLGIHPTSAEEFVTMRTLTRVAGLAHAAE
jgi:glutathione reductase (NADPH)